MRDLERQLTGYRLTTAEILYRMPDHPSLLQSFIWQKLDIAPRYPVLQRFLSFWEEEIEAKIHSVRIAQKGIVGAAAMRRAGPRLTLH